MCTSRSCGRSSRPIPASRATSSRSSGWDISSSSECPTSAARHAARRAPSAGGPTPAPGVRWSVVPSRAGVSPHRGSINTPPSSCHPTCPAFPWSTHRQTLEAVCRHLGPAEFGTTYSDSPRKMRPAIDRRQVHDRGAVRRFFRCSVTRAGKGNARRFRAPPRYDCPRCAKRRSSSMIHSRTRTTNGLGMTSRNTTRFRQLKHGNWYLAAHKR